MFKFDLVVNRRSINFYFKVKLKLKAENAYLNYWKILVKQYFVLGALLTLKYVLEWLNNPYFNILEHNNHL